uniref:Uncharacterized protein n=1 Tax=Molossus molossus TaxID=27622 RepID=A0A7J8JXM9_MOLMO|nr:hypothetical protein HJG59_008110 [Molossus molossus]
MSMSPDVMGIPSPFDISRSFPWTALRQPLSTGLSLHSFSKGLSPLAVFLPHLQLPLQPTASCLLYSIERLSLRLGPWPGQLKSWTEEAEEPRGLAPWTTPSFLTVPCVMCPACRLPVWAESIVRNPSWDETSDITPASATCKIPPQPRGRPAHSHETGWTQRLWTWAAPCEEGVCPPQLPLQ